ncbi:MAG TPA: PspC domain-containing protein [Candidatus Limnocylindrales bacterium]|nr:PspC domain-containing protein [Candidatus Limnocylindrales bacterium]
MRERLYRSRNDRMLFGVAGGMADWLDIDPAIVRLVWALLILAGGVGLLLYIVAAIVIPEAPIGAGAGGSASAEAGPTGLASTGPRPMRRGSGNGAMIFGLILVVLGAWFLLRRFMPALDMSWVMPGALIVIGLVLIVGALGRSRGSDS